MLQTHTFHVTITDAFCILLSIAHVFCTTAPRVQNVALQMGLRLSSRSGQRITTLQRFAMRCDGCATVCQATGKVFCPACGHATLSRVSVSVGPDGVEQYGVRRKHVLRGTRYGCVSRCLAHCCCAMQRILCLTHSLCFPRHMIHLVQYCHLRVNQGAHGRDCCVVEASRQT